MPEHLVNINVDNIAIGKHDYDAGDRAVVSEADYLDLEMAGRFEDGTLTDLGTVAASEAPSLDDLLALTRINAAGEQAARRNAGRFAVEFIDSPFMVYTDWSFLPGPNSNVQISNSRLFANSSETNPVVAYVPLDRNYLPGERFHITTVVERAATDPGSFVYFGLSTRAFDSVAAPSAAYVDDLMIGLSGSSSSVLPFKGANLTGVTLPASGSHLGTLTAETYHLSIDGDEHSVSFSVSRTGAGTTTSVYAFSVPVAQLTGKSFGNVACVVGDTRGLTGHAIGPIGGILRSNQPYPEAQIVSDIFIEKVVPRHISISALNGDKWRLALPADYDPRTPAPLAINLHPAGSSVAPEQRPWKHAQEVALTNALLAAGYLVMGIADGAVANDATTDRYANDASMANYAEAWQYVNSHYAIAETVLYGNSMGAQVGLNLLARRTVPNIAACYFHVPGIDWSDVSAFGSYSAGIRAAYGVSTDEDLADALVGHDSMARAGWEFRGVPIRLVEVLDDTVAPPAVHVDPFLAKIAPYAAEASKRTVASGGHTSTAVYDAADLLAFLGRHVR